MAQENKTGIWYTSSAFILWGILPLYWSFMKQVSALELLSHRIVWSFLFVSLLITLKKQWPQAKQVFTSWKTIWSIVACSLLINVNWLIYIWAVNNGHVIETSLGYYINPLISVAFGIIFLQERLDRWQLIALFCAIVGVAIQTIEFGQIPWIALSLSITFALYGLTKKLLQVESIISLALETMIVTPVALGYLVFAEINTHTLGQAPLYILILIVFSGVIPSLPLIWFARGAQLINLSTVGFIQYLEPTFNLLLGIFFFHESFTKTDLISFAFIWLALTIYTLTRMRFIHNLLKRKRLIKENH